MATEKTYHIKQKKDLYMHISVDDTAGLVLFLVCLILTIGLIIGHTIHKHYNNEAEFIRKGYIQIKVPKTWETIWVLPEAKASDPNQPILEDSSTLCK